MKRSPLVRKTPMTNRPGRTKQRRWSKVRQEALDRDRGLCRIQVEGCDVQAGHVHHVILRSRGGPDELWNLVSCCNPCHTWVHGNPTEATRLGWMRSAPGPDELQ